MSRFAFRHACAIALLTNLAAVAVAHAAVCHVAANAQGNSNGNTWSDAYTDLQSALGRSSCTEIWVAAGVYKPAAAGSQGVSFNIPPGVAVYGGFVGGASGETERAQRDPAANLTVLSGDIDINDTGSGGVDASTAQIQGNNSHSVVLMDGTTTAGAIGTDTVLDGFTITGGDGTGATTGGGGLYCDGNGSGHGCSPSLSHLVFSGNRATYGGALEIDGANGAVSKPRISDVAFVRNAASNGGAIENYGNGGESSPSLVRVTFNNNQASYGGAVFNEGNSGNASPSFTNVTFYNNRATFGGAAVLNSGPGGISSPTFTNVTFSYNAGSNTSGAMFNTADTSGESHPVLTNVVMWGDTASGNPKEISNDGAQPVIAHSLVQTSNGSGSNWNVALGTDGGGNLDADPLLALLTDNGGSTLTMMPGSGSPVIDAGDDHACPSADQRGLLRAYLPPCDMGAVEVGSLAAARVSDASDYARYGQAVHYLISVHNRTNHALSGIAVSSDAPAALDVTQMHWVCVAGAGTQCTPAGNGALADSGVTVPYGASATWILSAPVLPNAAGDNVTFHVTVNGATSLQRSDSDALVLFRAGFDTAGGNGTNVVTALCRGGRCAR